MAAIGKILKCSCRAFLQSTPVRSQIRLQLLQPSSVRLISTSKETKDSLTVPDNTPEFLEEVEKFKEISKYEDNWVSHGYNPYDPEDDLYSHHQTMFAMVTLGLIGGIFIFAYYPDFRLVHWKQREAYLELARREKNGLPLIDPNLVDPEKMKQYLPSDEELGDTEIII